MNAPLFLVVRIFKNGRVRVLASCDTQDQADDFLLYISKVYEEELKEGAFSLEVYHL